MAGAIIRRGAAVAAGGHDHLGPHLAQALEGVGGHAGVERGRLDLGART